MNKQSPPTHATQSVEMLELEDIGVSVDGEPMGIVEWIDVKNGAVRSSQIGERKGLIQFFITKKA